MGENKEKKTINVSMGGFTVLVISFILLILVLGVGIGLYVSKCMNKDNANQAPVEQNIVAKEETQNNTNRQIENSSTVKTPEDTDKIAKELFEQGSQEIRTLLYGGMPGDIKKASNTIETINGTDYYKTNNKFSEMEEKYSKWFTGNALENVLGTKFYNKNGVLYITTGWGATGIDITNLKVEKISRNDDEIKYVAKFNNLNMDDSIGKAQTSEFKIKKVNGNYKISEIDYLINDN